jgi:hypothetical protein
MRKNKSHGDNVPRARGIFNDKSKLTQAKRDTVGKDIFDQTGVTN